MADLEKTLRGLEICSEHGSWHGLDCELNEAYKDCPYRGCETGCIVTIAKDAIALLKEYQEKQEGLPPAWQDRTQEHICQKCGGIVWQEDNYCSKCGQKVKWGA